jgi:hypothetical protein
MRRFTVESTCLRTIGYEAGVALLELAFKERFDTELRNRIYEYRDVPRSLFEDFLNAPSKGRFFHDRIDPYFWYRERGESNWRRPRGGIRLARGWPGQREALVRPSESSSGRFRPQ